MPSGNRDEALRTYSCTLLEISIAFSLPVRMTKQHVDLVVAGDDSFDEIESLLQALASPESQAAAGEYTRAVLGEG